MWREREREREETDEILLTGVKFLSISIKPELLFATHLKEKKKFKRNDE